MSDYLGIAMLTMGSIAVTGSSIVYRHNAVPVICAPVQTVAGPDPATTGQNLTRNPDGMFYTFANINGHTIRLLIDTGASELMLSTGEARRLGVLTDDSGPDSRVLTIGGPVRLARVTLDHVRIAGQSFDDVTALILPIGSSIGLMGQSLLSRFKHVSIEGDLMKLHGVATVAPAVHSFAKVNAASSFQDVVLLDPFIRIHDAATTDQAAGIPVKWRCGGSAGEFPCRRPEQLAHEKGR
jgi:aspartyl protease family protein